jgi:hypothetical protein
LLHGAAGALTLFTHLIKRMPTMMEEKSGSNETFSNMLREQTEQVEKNYRSSLLHRESTEEIDNRSSISDTGKIEDENTKHERFSSSPPRQLQTQLTERTRHLSEDKIDEAKSAPKQREALPPSSVLQPKIVNSAPGRTHTPVYNIRDTILERETLQRGASLRRRHDEKVVGLKHALRETGKEYKSSESLDASEEEAHKKAERGPVRLMLLGNVAAAKVFLYYLITIDTLISLAFALGLTMYWYTKYVSLDREDSPKNSV